MKLIMTNVEKQESVTYMIGKETTEIITTDQMLRLETPKNKGKFLKDVINNLTEQGCKIDLLEL